MLGEITLTITASGLVLATENLGSNNFVDSLLNKHCKLLSAEVFPLKSNIIFKDAAALTAFLFLSVFISYLMSMHPLCSTEHSELHVTHINVNKN